MKTSIFSVLFLMATLSQSSYAATALDGNYTVVDSAGCQSLELSARGFVTVTTSATDFKVTTEYGFQSTFAFNVGHDANVFGCTTGFCYGDEQFSFDSSYSANGTQFVAVETVIEVLTGVTTPTYTGETRFTLANGTLTIDSTADSQPSPSPLQTCVLTKVP